jgi:hypothetical protein
MKTAINFLGAAVIALALFAHAADSGPQTFEGEISDSQCAMNVHSLTHSHQEMLKSKSHGTTPADCVAYCIKYLGGHFVLASSNEVYRLDNEDLAKPYAARKVKVIGYLDKKSKTIHTIRVEPL